MTLKGEMALAIVRAILARPEKFSRGLAEAAVRFNRFWTGTSEENTWGRDFTSGEDYWNLPENIERFPQSSTSWQQVQQLLPEDFAEKLDS